MTTLVTDLGRLRMLLLAQSVSSVPGPLLVSVACWLLVIFLAFSLLAPPNATTTLSLIAAALSVAGAVFLILELDQPFRGLIRIPPDPLLHALTYAAPGAH
jgi:zinc transporter ZupT